MDTCSCGAPAVVVVYPNFAAYNATTYDRPRVAMCGDCLQRLQDDKVIVRVSPFAFVRTDIRED